MHLGEFPLNCQKCSDNPSKSYDFFLIMKICAFLLPSLQCTYSLTFNNISPNNVPCPLDLFHY
jgi:hypothetical protein